jgi:hypothetical protein
MDNGKRCPVVHDNPRIERVAKMEFSRILDKDVNV